MGEGEGKRSEERFPSPSPNPTSFLSKTFDVIESLPSNRRVGERSGELFFLIEE